MHSLKCVTLFSWGLYLGAKEALILHSTPCFRDFIDLGQNANYKCVNMRGNYISGCRLWPRPHSRQQKKTTLKFISELALLVKQHRKQKFFHLSVHIHGDLLRRKTLYQALMRGIMKTWPGSCKLNGKMIKPIFFGVSQTCSFPEPRDHSPG